MPSLFDYATRELAELYFGETDDKSLAAIGRIKSGYKRLSAADLHVWKRLIPTLSLEETARRAYEMEEIRAIKTSPSKETGGVIL